MPDTHRDPLDHSRTAQPHAGESMKDNYYWPGFILMAIGVLALIAGVAAAAYEHQELIFWLGIVAVVGLGAGAVWFAFEHRRVQRIEARWHAEHSDQNPERHTV